MNNSTSLLVLLLLFFTISCAQRGKCLEEEERIIKTASDSSAIELSSLFKLEWDTLFIISGPRFPDDVSQVIGVNYAGTIDDDSRQYIFLDRGQIVRDSKTTCEHLDYFGVMKGPGFVRYTRDDHIIISCEDLAGETICRVVNSQKAKF